MQIFDFASQFEFFCKFTPYYTQSVCFASHTNFYCRRVYSSRIFCCFRVASSVGFMNLAGGLADYSPPRLTFLKFSICQASRTMNFGGEFFSCFRRITGLYHCLSCNFGVVYINQARGYADFLLRDNVSIHFLIFISAIFHNMVCTRLHNLSL